MRGAWVGEDPIGPALPSTARTGEVHGWPWGKRHCGPYPPAMAQGSGAGPLGRVFEAASLVESVEAVTRELGMALHAADVSFLIADLSGRALVRLAHVP